MTQVSEPSDRSPDCQRLAIFVIVLCTYNNYLHHQLYSLRQRLKAIFPCSSPNIFAYKA